MVTLFIFISKIDSQVHYKGTFHMSVLQIDVRISWANKKYFCSSSHSYYSMSNMYHSVDQSSRAPSPEGVEYGSGFMG